MLFTIAKVIEKTNGQATINNDFSGLKYTTKLAIKAEITNKKRLFCLNCCKCCQLATFNNNKNGIKPTAKIC